jgi:hypothetical protein
MTAHTLIDLTGEERRVVPMCTRCVGGPDDSLDHPKPMPLAEGFDTVPCPECGATGGLALPVERPPDTRVGVEGRGIAVCQRCKAEVSWGSPTILF